MCFIFYPCLAHFENYELIFLQGLQKKEKTQISHHSQCLYFKVNNSHFRIISVIFFLLNLMFFFSADEHLIDWLINWLINKKWELIFKCFKNVLIRRFLLQSSSCFVMGWCHDVIADEKFFPEASIKMLTKYSDELFIFLCNKNLQSLKCIFLGHLVFWMKHSSKYTVGAIKSNNCGNHK